MCGTLLCVVDDSEDGRKAVETAVDLSERLGSRLVLAHADGGIPAIAADGDHVESVSMKAAREGAARALSRLAAELNLSEGVERRTGAGDPATVIGRIAAEEAADLIVVGSRTRGVLRRGFQSRLAEQLRSETPVPVLIAPPTDRAAGRMAA
jgi:nucleotide-binding universal stress UspA family protein